MSSLFADTFYWIALTNPLESAHERAKQVRDNIVTIQEVLIEYLNFFAQVRRICAARLQPHGLYFDGGHALRGSDRRSHERPSF